MPQIKSQIKRMKTSEARRQRNRSVKSEIHTSLKAFHEAVAAEDKDQAQVNFKHSVKLLDQAASKKVLHKNNAANKKSKMAKTLKSLA